MGHDVSPETREKLQIASTGRRLSEEAKRKVGEASRGRVVSQETRDKLSKINKGRKLNLTDEQRKRMSEIHKGRKWTEEHYQKVVGKRRGPNNPLYGTHLSEEAKAKLSEALKGRPAWNKGIPCSEEHKRKQSEAMKGRPSLRKRAVQDLTTGKIYESVKAAYEDTGFSHIDACARGERNVAGGHKWKYIDE